MKVETAGKPRSRWHGSLWTSSKNISAAVTGLWCYCLGKFLDARTGRYARCRVDGDEGGLRNGGQTFSEQGRHGGCLDEFMHFLSRYCTRETMEGRRGRIGKTKMTRENKHRLTDGAFSRCCPLPDSRTYPCVYPLLVPASMLTTVFVFPPKPRWRPRTLSLAPPPPNPRPLLHVGGMKSKRRTFFP